MRLARGRAVHCVHHCDHLVAPLVRGGGGQGGPRRSRTRPALTTGCRYRRWRDSDGLTALAVLRPGARTGMRHDRQGAL